MSDVARVLVQILLAKLIELAAMWAMHKLARKFGVA